MSAFSPAATKGLLGGQNTSPGAVVATTTIRFTSTITTVATILPSKPQSSSAPGSSSPFADENTPEFSPPTPGFIKETQSLFPTPAPTFLDIPSTTSVSTAPATSEETSFGEDPPASSTDVTQVEPLPLESVNSTPAFSDLEVSTIISASTDSTLGVHTFTQVTTIATFRPLPTRSSDKPNKETEPTGGGSPSPSVGVVIMAVMGGLVVCALALLALYWRRRRRRRRPDYEFAGYGYEPPRSDTWRQRFGWALGRHPHERLDPSPGSDNSVTRFTISSFGNSRSTTPTPFYGRRGIDALAQNPHPHPALRVQFTEPFRDDSNGVKGQARPRNREGWTPRDRPPTYHTTSTGIATIATTLPLYSAYDPSPISERSEIPDTPTTATTPRSPLYGREKPRRSPRANPLTPIGEKF